MTMGIVLSTSGQMEIVVHDDAVAMAKLKIGRAHV